MLLFSRYLELHVSASPMNPSSDRTR